MYVGLGALALTGVGAILSSSVIGATTLGGGLSWLGGAILSTKFAVLSVGGILAYKTANGTLDSNDLLMGALSLGPLAAGRLIKYTGIGKILAPKAANALVKLDNALTGGRIRGMIKAFEEKMANLGGGAARGISEVQRESILTRLRSKKWSVTDDFTKLADDELRIVNEIADGVEKIPEIKHLRFIDDSRKGFMATLPDGTVIINKAVSARDLSYFRSILNHESGHLLHVDPATGKYFSWDKFMKGFGNSRVKVPKFNGVEDDLEILEQIVADKNAFVRNSALKQEFSEWIKNVHISNLIQNEFKVAKPELIRSLVYAKNFDPELLPIIERSIKNKWGDVLWLTNFDDGLNGIKPFVKFSEEVVIKL